MDEQKQEILAECYDDPALAAMIFVPHWFPGPKAEGGARAPRVDALHRGLLAVLLRQCDFLLKYDHCEWIEENFIYTDPDGGHKKIFDLSSSNSPQMTIDQFTLIMMPRGFAKTTCNNFAILFNILFREVDFSAYVGETSAHADRQVSNIKYELETNTKIHQYFGSLKPDLKGPLKWTDEFFEANNGTALVGRGSGTQIRGLLNKGRRPQRFLLDDLETRESVKTDTQRQEKKEWYYGDVEPALDELDEDSSITATGTLLHEDALLANLMQDPRWTVVKFGALDENDVPIWHRKGWDWFNRKKAAFLRAGMLHVFYLEYMNEVRAPDHQDFEQRMINVQPQPQGDMIARAICIDPAISEASNADFCGIGVMGMTEKGMLHVFECFLQRGVSPREQVDKYFELAMRYDCNPEMHGVESIAYQAALIHLLREEMGRKGWFFTPQKVTHKDLSNEQRNKIARIRGTLQPRYANGYVTHQMHMPVYEGQLLDFPRGKKDGPDVMSMCVGLLDPVAGVAQKDDPEEDEYEPLEDILGDWRSH